METGQGSATVKVIMAVICAVCSISALAREPDTSAIDVLHYHLQLDIHEDEQIVSGVSSITFRVLENDLDSLQLDLVYLSADSVFSGGVPARFQQLKYSVLVEFPHQLSSGDTAEVCVHYSGSPGTNPERRLDAGFYWDQLLLEQPVYMFYSMEPASCRYLFPGIDDIQDKAAFTTVVTVTDTLTAVAPGMLVQVDEVAGRRTFTWEMRRQMPLYTWALAISDYTAIQDDTYPWVIYYATSGLEDYTDEVYGNVNMMLDCFTELFGPYPWDHDLKFPCVPYWACAEHNTMPFAYIPMEEYVAHELSHMWWGNCVTEEDWDEIWLAEGLASYSEALWQEWMYGGKQYRECMGNMMTYYLESGENLPIVPATGYLWTSTVYEKGACVMHMLRHTIGDQAFFQGLGLYLRDNAYDYASTEDLQAAMEAASGMDLDRFFQQWIYWTGFPEYSIDWESSAEGNQWKTQLIIEQMQSDSVFIMPMEIRVRGAAGDTVLEIVNDARIDSLLLWTSSQPVDIQLDPDVLILRSRVSGVRK